MKKTEYALFQNDGSGGIIYNRQGEIVCIVSKESKEFAKELVDKANSHEAIKEKYEKVKNWSMKAIKRINKLSDENKVWETNYNNLQSKYEEMASIAYSKSQELERLKNRIEELKARYGA